MTKILAKGGLNKKKKNFNANNSKGVCVCVVCRVPYNLLQITV